jgi:AcrR family transcriptional regulator
MATTKPQEPRRRRRSDGERSRAAILDAAARLATVEGLDGLSIGRLAVHTGMSKSGLFAHFGSKEELQLATVATAEEVFTSDVLEPARAAPDGLPRLEALCRHFLSHVERGVFPGGCFFTSVATEFDTRPGPVRERVAAFLGGWVAELRAAVAAAQLNGELAASEDPDQLTFEVQAALLMANTVYVLYGDPTTFDRARTAIANILERSPA